MISYLGCHGNAPAVNMKSRSRLVVFSEGNNFASSLILHHIRLCYPLVYYRAFVSMGQGAIFIVANRTDNHTGTYRYVPEHTHYQAVVPIFRAISLYARIGKARDSAVFCRIRY